MPLHLAAGEGKSKMVRFLIESGVNVGAINNKGWTVLHTALWKGDLKIVKLILRLGVDVDSRNHINRTAADLASDNARTEVASFLAEYEGGENVHNLIC
jgi:uncharacterized protein